MADSHNRKRQKHYRHKRTPIPEKVLKKPTPKWSYTPPPKPDKTLAQKASSTELETEQSEPVEMTKPEQNKEAQSSSVGLSNNSESSGMEPSSAAEPSVVAEETKKSITATTTPGVTRVYDMVKRFYSSSGTPKKIPETAFKKLEERGVSGAQYEDLLMLASKEDPTLTRTLNLAFAANETRSDKVIKSLLLMFAVDVGRKVFDQPLENVDYWLPKTSDDKHSILELVKRYAAIDARLVASEALKAKEKKEGRAKIRNILFLNVLWQTFQGWAKEDDLLRLLRAESLFNASSLYPGQAQESLLKTAYADTAGEFSSLSWLAKQVEATKQQQKSEIDRLQREAEQMAVLQDRANEEIASLREEREALTAQVNELEQRLRQEQQNVQTTSVHLEDDKHRLRSQVTKGLKSEVPRLEEALTALRRDPPKLHIVSHYVEETLLQIKEILRKTEGE